MNPALRHRHRNRRLVFDDAEVLWNRPGGRVLMRSLTEHRGRKLVQWMSTARELAKARVPQRFYTTSKVAVIANRFAFGSEEEREAVLDRGHLVHFAPMPLEIHQRVGDWFWCQEIYDYLGERLHMLDNHSARTYLKCWERKQAGGDWRKLISEVFCHKNAILVVQELEADPECPTVDDRIRKFIHQTGLSRATYFNMKDEGRGRLGRTWCVFALFAPFAPFAGSVGGAPNTEKREVVDQKQEAVASGQRRRQEAVGSRESGVEG